jgi:hypothetical protein
MTNLTSHCNPVKVFVRLEMAEIDPGGDPGCGGGSVALLLAADCPRRIVGTPCLLR